MRYLVCLGFGGSVRYHVLSEFDSADSVRIDSCIRVHCLVLMFHFGVMLVVEGRVVVVVLENVVFERIVVGVVVVVDQLVKRMVFAVLSGKIGLVSRKILLGRGRSTLADP